MNKIEIKNLIKLFQQAGLLKKIKRTGWVLCEVENAESVAEHIYRLSIMAMVIAPKLNLDTEKMMKMALIHDMGEAIIGDMKWEAGKTIVASQEEKHKDEENAIKKLFGTEKQYHAYLELWNEFNEQKTREARILKLIDKLEMIIQAYEYQQEGVSSDKLIEFWENGEKYLANPELEDVFKYLLKLRSKLNPIETSI